jgi:ATP-dependent Clp protease ATP-binding subunit ClpB
MRDLRGHFRPEFLNRIDEIVLFKPLSLNEITSIVDLLLADVTKRLTERGITITVSDEAKKHIAQAGYDPVYGARPLKRYIQRELETRVGRALIADELHIGSAVLVGVKDGALTVETRAGGESQAA